MMRQLKHAWWAPLVVLAIGLTQMPLLEAQVARGRRGGTVVKGEERTVATSRRGVAVKGEEGYAAVGRRGGVVASDGERAVAANRRGVVVAGEEGVAAAGRYGGVVVGDRYEDHDGWRTAAAVAGGVAAGIAIGTMLSRPPAMATRSW